MTPPKYRPRPVAELPAVRAWMDVKQVATRLGVSKMTVYRLVNEEILRAYRVGRSIRVDAKDFERFLSEANTVSWERPGGAS